MINTLTKVCNKCRVDLPLEHYYNSGNSKDGKAYCCKVCNWKRNKEWRSKNPDKVKATRDRYAPKYKEIYKRKKKEEPDRYRSYWLKARFGISLDEYNKKLELQNFGCAICYCKNKKLAVDHCHLSGSIRGLLCNSCNSAIGFAKESTKLLTNMIQYIEKYKGN